MGLVFTRQTNLTELQQNLAHTDSECSAYSRRNSGCIANIFEYFYKRISIPYPAYLQKYTPELGIPAEFDRMHASRC